MTLEEVLLGVAIQFPIVLVILVGQRRGWWVDGKKHDEIVDRLEKDMAYREEQHQKEMTFRELLRQEAITDKNAVVEAANRQQEQLKELGNVVRQSLDFNERLIDEREAAARDREWDGSTERRRSRPGSRGRT